MSRIEERSASVSDSHCGSRVPSMDMYESRCSTFLYAAVNTGVGIMNPHLPTEITPQAVISGKASSWGFTNPCHPGMPNGQRSVTGTG